jgi:hypothetical protein
MIVAAMDLPVGLAVSVTSWMLFSAADLRVDQDHACDKVKMLLFV